MWKRVLLAVGILAALAGLVVGGYYVAREVGLIARVRGGEPTVESGEGGHVVTYPDGRRVTVLDPIEV